MCRLPLTRQESYESICPVCHERLYDVEPDPDELLDVDEIEADGEDISLDVDLPPEEQTDADDEQEEASSETKRRICLAITIVSIVALIVAGVVLTNIFSPKPAGDDPSQPWKDRLASALPEPAPLTRPADDKPAVKPDVKPDDDPDDEPDVTADVRARQARRLKDPQDIPEFIADIPPDQELDEFGEKVEIDAPRGAHEIDAVEGRGNFQLSGNVRKLTICGVDNEGAVTTDKLAAKEVIISGPVKVAASLKLDVPGALVTLLGNLDGAARVRINAPGGKVAAGSTDRKDRGGMVVGSAHLTIIAKDVDPKLRFMPGSRGRIGAGRNECLCVGETRADYRTILKRLADLPYIKRIIECHFE